MSDPTALTRTGSGRDPSSAASPLPLSASLAGRSAAPSSQNQRSNPVASASQPTMRHVALSHEVLRVLTTPSSQPQKPQNPAAATAKPLAVGLSRPPPQQHQQPVTLAASAASAGPAITSAANTLRQRFGGGGGPSAPAPTSGPTTMSSPGVALARGPSAIQPVIASGANTSGVPSNPSAAIGGGLPNTAAAVAAAVRRQVEVQQHLRQQKEMQLQQFAQQQQKRAGGPPAPSPQVPQPSSTSLAANALTTASGRGKPAGAVAIAVGPGNATNMMASLPSSNVNVQGRPAFGPGSSGAAARFGPGPAPPPSHPSMPFTLPPPPPPPPFPTAPFVGLNTAPAPAAPARPSGANAMASGTAGGVAGAGGQGTLTGSAFQRQRYGVNAAPAAGAGRGQPLSIPPPPLPPPTPPSPIEVWHNSWILERVQMPSSAEVLECVTAQLRQSTLPPDCRIGTVVKIIPERGFGFILPKEEVTPGILEDSDDDDASGAGTAGNTNLGPDGLPTVPGEQGNDAKRTILFYLGSVVGPRPQEHDRVSFRMVSGLKGRSAVDVAVITEPGGSGGGQPQQQLSTAAIDQFLESVRAASEPRAVLVNVMQRFRVWRQVLGNRRLSPAQILAVVDITTRKPLTSLMMKTSLNTLYTSVLKSSFVRTSLPHFVLNSSECVEKVVHDVEELCQLLHDFGAAKLRTFLHPLCVAVLAWHRREGWRFIDLDQAKRLGGLHSVLGEPTNATTSSSTLPANANATTGGIVSTTDSDDNTAHPIYPGENDFKIPADFRPDTLPKNKENGPFASPEEYLLTQFKLLRADCFARFVDSMHYRAFAQNEFEALPEHQKRIITTSVRFYTDIELAGVNMTAYGPSLTQWTLCFTPLENEDWASSNRMELGRLLMIVAFSETGNELFWVVVTHRDPWLLERGIVGVEFVKGDPLLLLHCLDSQRLAGTAHQARLCESNIFFPAYRPILHVLRHLIAHPKELPFQSFLVQALPQPYRPQYIRENLAHFQAACTELIENGTLDESQQYALRAMEHAFLLVQGPPGTGKGYVGVWMARLIFELRNRVNSEYMRERRAQMEVSIAPLLEEEAAASHVIDTLSADIASLRKALQTNAAAEGLSGAARAAQIRAKQKEIEHLTQEHEAAKQTKSMCAFRRQQIQTAFNNDSLKQRRTLGPTVVVTHKNHSLDEFLSECLRWMPEADRGQMVRIGGVTRNEQLRKVNLAEYVREEMKSAAKSYETDLRRQLEACVRAQRLIIDQVAQLESGGLTPSTMIRFMTEDQSRSFGEVTQAAIDEWLGQEYVPTPINEWTIYAQNLLRMLEAEQPPSTGTFSDPTPTTATDSTAPLSSPDTVAGSGGSGELDAEGGHGQHSSPVRPTTISGPWERMPEPYDYVDVDEEEEAHGAVLPPRPELTPETREAARRLMLIFRPATVEFLRGFAPVLHGRHAFTKEAAKADKEAVPPVIANTGDLRALSADARAALAGYWVHRQMIDLYERYRNAMAEYEELNVLLREHLNQVKLDVLSKAELIGLTTTGCAAHLDLLREVHPTVLIVEEAAQVLEAQIVSLLTPFVQQVVLLGDDQQLKPLVNNQALARGCRIDLSLFERMSNNDVRCQMLCNQRRMTDELSALVKPIYDHLYDDPSLQGRRMITAQGSVDVQTEGIPGMTMPVYFWTHDRPEQSAIMTARPSLFNPTEVHMCHELCLYLLANGVLPSSITVLTPYRGQLLELRKSFAASAVEEGEERLEQIVIQTVDRFQGEENDIIILSLVRTREISEFLRRKDRMVVALSRARFGLFVLGNHKLFEDPSCPHWQNTLRTLERAYDGAPCRIGPTLPLHCSLHPDSRFGVAAGRNIPIAGGFCRASCGLSFTGCTDPTHRCTRQCHGPVGGHESCPYLCSRSLRCGHKCLRLCSEPCDCGIAEEVTMGCSHEEIDGYDERSAKIRYRVVPHAVLRKCGDPLSLQCTRPVLKQRAACMHEVTVACHLDPDSVPCLECEEDARREQADLDRTHGPHDLTDDQRAAQRERAGRLAAETELERKRMADIVAYENALANWRDRVRRSAFFAVRIWVVAGHQQQQLSVAEWRAKLGNLAYAEMDLGSSEGNNSSSNEARVFCETEEQRAMIVKWSEQTFLFFNIAAEVLERTVCTDPEPVLNRSHQTVPNTMLKELEEKRQRVAQWVMERRVREARRLQEQRDADQRDGEARRRSEEAARKREEAKKREREGGGGSSSIGAGGVHRGGSITPPPASSSNASAHHQRSEQNNDNAVSSKAARKGHGGSGGQGGPSTVGAVGSGRGTATGGGGGGRDFDNFDRRQRSTGGFRSDAYPKGAKGISEQHGDDFEEEELYDKATSPNASADHSHDERTSPQVSRNESGKAVDGSRGGRSTASGSSHATTTSPPGNRKWIPSSQASTASASSAPSTAGPSASHTTSSSSSSASTAAESAPSASQSKPSSTIPIKGGHKITIFNNTATGPLHDEEDEEEQNYDDDEYYDEEEGEGHAHGQSAEGGQGGGATGAAGGGEVKKRVRRGGKRTKKARRALLLSRPAESGGENGEAGSGKPPVTSDANKGGSQTHGGGPADHGSPSRDAGHRHQEDAEKKDGRDNDGEQQQGGGRGQKGFKRGFYRRYQQW